MKDHTVIVCSDSLEQQAQLSGQLALHYDNIIGCQLIQVEGMLTDPQSSVMVVSWSQPTAELKLLIDFAVGCKCPLVVMVGDLHKGSIKDFPHANQYVILPFRGDYDLNIWLEHATRLRDNMLAIEKEVQALTQKLDDRKWIEKAKGTLMKMHHIDEEEAYKALRNSAMKSSQPIGQVAKNLMLTFDSIS
ncbi:conserved hypothetical protein with ANTAR domain [Vibrio nigripulchritudo MADA3029]|uniref:ANTAR domain-containing response regulator n=1 Tax=Vibrio nigripulchritudo TaxID=28173 RepID=UPI0003B1B521|nr:ANTAR domain-containing protein [Vibrio nigripulchritudo]CCN49581.1 conserved hypothetical protein with ANTAR domain [Vibrio nigripulchritudo MADA3020]CCN53685.1 conserved hypothetical protein with ANTAR domain [Vibrio nigripulchritudo MADA3021]CCN58518.1 conserved hypothetical protein with ANTAR domain [Vibrio nigripulchritudo MADA3029]